MKKRNETNGIYFGQEYRSKTGLFFIVSRKESGRTALLLKLWKSHRPASHAIVFFSRSESTARVKFQSEWFIKAVHVQYLAYQENVPLIVTTSFEAEVFFLQTKNAQDTLRPMFAVSTEVRHGCRMQATTLFSNRVPTVPARYLFIVDVLGLVQHVRPVEERRSLLVCVEAIVYLAELQVYHTSALHLTVSIAN